MLDDDFNRQMAALDQRQRGANDRHARDIQPMGDDLAAMRARFEREMRGRQEGTTGSGDQAKSGDGARASAATADQSTGAGMRRQMESGEAVKETKRGRTDVGTGTRVV